MKMSGKRVAEMLRCSGFDMRNEICFKIVSKEL